MGLVIFMSCTITFLIGFILGVNFGKDLYT